MNWIKQNTFLFGLAVVSVVGAIVLWMLGSSASGRYEEAKKRYDAALEEASRFEKLDPYPSAEHVEAKKIAIAAYSESTDELQKSFAQYRPAELENISVQAFSSAVKLANKETRAAFTKTEVPEAYFCGFELYRGGLPAGDATGILNYQLQVTKQIMLNLASAGATKLVSVHRPKLPEEEGKKFQPDPGQVARALPLEIVFKGPEASARQFLSTLANDKEHYLVVRSIRIANEKLIPPRKTDAKFTGGNNRRPTGGGGETGSEAVDFSALFDPNNAAKPATPEGAQPATPPTPVTPEPAPEPVPGDSSRILAQVLGQEEIQVFVRLDLMLFLEPKELP